VDQPTKRSNIFMAVLLFDNVLTLSGTRRRTNLMQIKSRCGAGEALTWHCRQLNPGEGAW
jgi:hypothetical protein